MVCGSVLLHLSRPKVRIKTQTATFFAKKCPIVGRFGRFSYLRAGGGPERATPIRKPPERKPPERKLSEYRLPEHRLPERRLPERMTPNLSSVPPLPVLAALLLYALLLLVVARLSARRAGNAAFFTAERRTPWYVAWWAMIGAAMSGITFVSVPGSVAADAFSYLQMMAGFTVGQLIVAYRLVPLFYRGGYTSIYEYLDRRFGPCAHRTGAWVFFLSKLSVAALKLYIVCAVLQQLLFDRCGIPFWGNALVTVAVVWGYTRRGGVRSVIGADLLKTTLLLAALGATIGALLARLELSPAEAWREVWNSPMSRILFLDDPASERYFWKMFAAGIVLLVAMTGLDQDLMQCNLTCRTLRDAQRNILLTALCQVVVIGLFLMLGVLLYRYADATGMPLPGKSDRLFPLVATGGGLPAAVGMLFVAGFAASSFSAAGSSLTALTTSFTIDLLGGAKRYGQARLLRVRRRVHVALGGCMALLVALFGYGADESTINLIFKVAGYTYGPILGLFLFGRWSRLRVRDGLVWLPSVLAPLLAALLQQAALRWCGYRIGFELLLYNAALTMAGLWLLRERRVR